MADRVITAEALITARDGTGDVFAKLGSKIEGMAKKAKASAEIEKMNAALEKSKGALAALEKVQASRAKFADARAGFNAQKTAVEAAAKALAGAAKPTRELEANYKRAQVAVSRASAEFEKQKGALLSATRAAEQFGFPLSKIASEQGRLRESIASTTAAIERQGAAELRAAEDAKKAAAAHRALEKEQEKRSHEIGHHGIVNYALGSAAAAVSAHGIFHVGERAIEGGAELQHERVASANAGRTPEEIKAFTEAAKRAAIAVPTASYTESMKTLLETTSSFGSVEHAIDHLNFMMKTAATLKAASGGKIDESAGEMGQQFAKFFEMRGVAGDPKRFELEGNEMVRAMAATGGTFNPREMFNFASTAKSALRLYDQDYLTRMIPSIIGEQGGDRAGTSANAFYQVIMGKARDKKQLAKWMEFGLLDPKMVSDKKDSWSSGAVKNTDLALSNPLKWFETTVLPAMQAKGIKVDDTMELSKALGGMFRNGMSNQFANENAQLSDRTRLHKDKALTDKTLQADEMYQKYLHEDPTVAMQALTASLDSLGAAVTAPAMKSAAGTIERIAEALTHLAAVATDHPIAAMTAGGVAGAAALGGAGYASYQLMNGFGLGASATALDGSAAALTGAAEALSASAGKQALTPAVGAGAAAAGGGILAGLGVSSLGAGLLSWYMGEHGFGVMDPKKFEDTPENRQKTQNIGSDVFGGSDDVDQPPPPVYGPTRPAPPKSSWWQWIKDSIIGSAHAEPGLTHPLISAFGGLDAAKASFGAHPAMAPPHPSLMPASQGQSGPITATVQQPVPVDVSGKVTAEVKGQANVSVVVKVDGPGTVEKQVASSSGNIKVSTGASMPGAAKASSGSAATK